MENCKYNEEFTRESLKEDLEIVTRMTVEKTIKDNVLLVPEDKPVPDEEESTETEYNQFRERIKILIENDEDREMIGVNLEMAITDDDHIINHLKYALHCPSCDHPYGTKSNRNRHLRTQVCIKTVRKIISQKNEVTKGQLEHALALAMPNKNIIQHSEQEIEDIFAPFEEESPSQKPSQSQPIVASTTSKQPDIPTFYKIYDPTWTPGQDLSENTLDLMASNMNMEVHSKELMNFLILWDPTLKPDLLSFSPTNQATRSLDLKLRQLPSKTNAAQTQKLEEKNKLIPKFKTFLKNHPKKYSDTTISNYMGYIDGSFYSLAKYLAKADEPLEIEELDWNNVVRSQKMPPIQSITTWMSTSDATAATKYIMCAGVLKFMEFLEDIAIEPMSGSPQHNDFMAWENKINKVKKDIRIMNATFKEDKEKEAKVQKKIKEMLDPEGRERNRKAVKNYQNSKHFSQLIDDCKPIQLSNPQMSQITTDLFKHLGRMLAVNLTLCAGQRGGITQYLEDDDVRTMKRNPRDPELWYLGIAKHDLRRIGKTNDPTYLNLDNAMALLLVKYMAIKPVVLANQGIVQQDKRLLVDEKGLPIQMKNIKQTTTWKAMGFPNSLTFTTNRSEATTEYATNPKTSSMNPKALLSHSSNTQWKTYYLNDEDDYAVGSSVLRQDLIPKSTLGQEPEQLEQLEQAVHEGNTELHLKLVLDFKRREGKKIR